MGEGTCKCCSNKETALTNINKNRLWDIYSFDDTTSNTAATNGKDDSNADTTTEPKIVKAGHHCWKKTLSLGLG